MEEGGWVGRVAEVLGRVEHRRALGACVWRAEAGSERVVVKVGDAVGDEAAGLAAIGDVDGAPPVPEVLLSEPGLLVLAWVEAARSGATASHHEDLGRALAALHGAPREGWGGGSGWIGACPVDPAPAPDGPSFYGRRLSGLADRCGLGSDLAGIEGRLAGILGPGGPGLVHGDLWWGNVLWGADGRAWVIDPSAHGGHPAEDLAMLGLFGPVPDRLRRAYDEVRPPGPGAEERELLLTLVPLLVHAVLFGGGFRARARAVLRRLR